MIDVSVVIVNWNTKQLLLKCLQSVIKERRKCNTQIIVVDNGSRDGSSEMVSKNFPNVELIVNKKNLGFAKANNIGIRQSTGRYVCLVNSDIIILDSCIDRMYAYMDQHHSIGMLGPKTLNSDLSLQLTCREFPTLWSLFCQASGLNTIFPKSKLFKDSFMTHFDHNSIRSVDVLTFCFLMFRREVLDKVGLLDENFFIYSEDIDWCKRFREEGWDIIFYPNAKVIHYGGASSSTAPIKFVLEMLKANFQYWKKYHGSISQITYLLIKMYHFTVRVVALFVLSLIRPSFKKGYYVKMKENIVRLNWILKNKLIMNKSK